MKIKKLLYSAKIHTKLLWIYFFLIILPLTFFMNISYYKVSSILKEQTLLQARQMFNDTVNIMEINFNNCLTALDIISRDINIYKIGTQETTGYSPVEQLIDSTEIIDNFNRIKSSTLVSDIHLFIDKDFIFSNENVNIFHVNTIKNSHWYRTMANTSEDTMWFSPIELSDTSSNFPLSYSLIRRFYDLSNYSTPVGFIKVSIAEDKFKKLIEESLITENSSILITDLNTFIQQKNFPSDISLNQLSHQLISLSEDNWHQVTLNKNKYFLAYHSFHNTPYKKISLIPYADIFNQSNSLLVFMLITMCAVAFVAYAIAVFISNSSIKRLYKLILSMQK